MAQTYRIVIHQRRNDIVNYECDTEHLQSYISELDEQKLQIWDCLSCYINNRTTNNV